jgi:hypothetical protein
VPGATAVGLRNPHSQTNAINTFREFVADHSLSSKLIIHLGEVDCGFVIWWRAQKYGESVEQQTKESLEAYREFVVELLDFGFREICVTGASLPTLGEGIDFGPVANMRAEVNIGLRERTELTRRYNAELAAIAKDYSLCYLDVSYGITDFSTGMVSNYFKNSDPRNHHVDKCKVAGLWAMACNGFLLREDCTTGTIISVGNRADQ